MGKVSEATEIERVLFESILGECDTGVVVVQSLLRNVTGVSITG